MKEKYQHNQTTRLALDTINWSHCHQKCKSAGAAFASNRQKFVKGMQKRDFSILEICFCNWEQLLSISAWHFAFFERVTIERRSNVWYFYKPLSKYLGTLITLTVRSHWFADLVSEWYIQNLYFQFPSYQLASITNFGSLPLEWLLWLSFLGEPHAIGK